MAGQENSSPQKQKQHSGLRRILREHFDPVTWLLAALTVPLAIWGTFRTANDAGDESFLTGALLTGTATLPVAWSVLRTIWTTSATTAIFVSLLRTIFMPLIFAWPPAIAVAITVQMPGIRAQIEGSRRPSGWRYFFGADDGSLLHQAIMLSGLAGLFFAMLVGLALSVFVVLPVLAWFKPIEAAQSNMLKAETKEDRAAAASGIRMLSIILMMTFGVPALLIFGGEEAVGRSPLDKLANALRFFSDAPYYYGDLLWTLGLLAIPVGIFLIIRLKMVQRPDIERRAKHGVNARDDQALWEAQQIKSSEEDPGAARPDRSSRPRKAD